MCLEITVFQVTFHQIYNLQTTIAIAIQKKHLLTNRPHIDTFGVSKYKSIDLINQKINLRDYFDEARRISGARYHLVAKGIQSGF